MADHKVPTVGEFGAILQQMLSRGKSVQQHQIAEPPMTKGDLGDLFAKIDTAFPDADTLESRKRIQWPVVETAFRDTYNRLVAKINSQDAAFAELWDLLDIISILSDEEQCDPPLLFWLVEELLDSQTIAGCRTVFDYLESRREKITAKHFAQKNLVILRSCNELLRRLSRADDTAFCGRVFIFLFQSFPLGDKSSVNLRGEFHTENTTTFDEPPKSTDEMQLDDGTPTIEVTTDNEKKPLGGADTSTKGVTFSKKDDPMSLDDLYPIFWSLQNYFSQPKNLFNQESLSNFKSGLEATITRFKAFPLVKQPVEDKDGSGQQKKSSKRKRSPTSGANSFNPRYLTRRDLFDLEIRDLTFQRNILVQALIVIEYLLSLSSKAKEKLTNLLPEKPNMSVLYTDLKLSDEDTEWAVKTKRVIADYIRGDTYEGQFYFRMVETVIARDKNWAWWKIHNCPSITVPAVSPDSFVKSKALAKKAATNKRIRPHPLQSLDLGFLKDTRSGLERLKEPSRYELPPVKSFQDKIELDDMDIDMAVSEEQKNQAMESKASKSWRALRIAGANNLVAFDKIEKSDKIDIVFKDKTEAVTAEEEEEDVKQPKDRKAIVISGPGGAGKSTLVSMLLERHPKVFGKKASHTTRKARPGEIHGTDYYFVNKEDFNVLRDGDEFLEFNNFNGNDYGTSSKVVQGIIAHGKVPIMEMDYHGIQQLKDNAYSARFIFLSSPSLAELEQRMIKRGSDTPEKIKERLEIAKEEIKQSEVEGFHDRIIINDDLETAYKRLEAYIFGDDEASADATETNTEIVPSTASTEEEPTTSTPMDVDESAKDQPL